MTLLLLPLALVEARVLPCLDLREITRLALTCKTLQEASQNGKWLHEAVVNCCVTPASRPALWIHCLRLDALLPTLVAEIRSRSQLQNQDGVVFLNQFESSCARRPHVVECHYSKEFIDGVVESAKSLPDQATSISRESSLQGAKFTCPEPTDTLEGRRCIHPQLACLLDKVRLEMSARDRSQPDTAALEVVPSYWHSWCSVNPAAQAVFAFLNDPACVQFPSSVANDIQKDLDRTFPTATLLSCPSGRAALASVLRAVACAVPVVGYCQGLNFVAGVFLLHTHCPVLSFWMTVALLKHFDGHLLYAPGVPLLALRLFQMEKTVRRQLPDAAKQLYNVSLNLQVFTHQWLMSFFAYFVDVATLAHIWDCFFMDGWKTLCRVATGIVKVFHPFLYTQDQDTVLKLVQDSRRLVSCLHRCDDISERLPCLDSEALASVSSKVLVDVAHVCILAVSRSARQLLRISYGFKVTNSMLSRYSLDFQTTKLLESARMPVLSYLQAGAISEPECSHTLLSSRRQEMIKDSWCSGEPLRGLIFTTGRDLTPSSWVVVIDTRNMIARDWPAQICPARPRDLLASGHPRVCFPPTETSAFASAEEYAHPSVDSLLQRLFLCSLFDTDSPMNGFLEGTATASYLYMSFRHFSDLVAMLIDVDQTIAEEFHGFQERDEELRRQIAGFTAHRKRKVEASHAQTKQLEDLHSTLQEVTDPTTPRTRSLIAAIFGDRPRTRERWRGGGMLENFVRRKEPSREDVVRDIGVLMTTKAQIDRELTRVKSQLDGLVEERKELIAEIQKTIDDVVAVRRADYWSFLHSRRICRWTSRLPSLQLLADPSMRSSVRACGELPSLLPQLSSLLTERD